jgi:putative transposase
LKGDKTEVKMLTIRPELKKEFKGYSVSPEIIMMFVYMKLRFSLSYRDLEEMMSMRGASIDHSTVQRWILKFAPLIEREVRKRKKPICKRWRMDETYVKIKGKWFYLYRAVDSEGNTIDFLLRERRDKAAALAFFIKAIKNNGRPTNVNIDKSGSNNAALEACNKGVKKKRQITIRQIKYLNNIIEQDHRFIKKRTKPMLGFKSFRSAKITLAGIESVRMIQKGQVHGFNESKSTFYNFALLMEKSA